MSMETDYKVKQIRGMQLKTSEEVYDKNSKKYINPQNIYGKVNRNYLNVVLSKNSRKGIIEDFHNLPKRYKNQIVEFFRIKKNAGRSVVYIVSKNHGCKNNK